MEFIDIKRGYSSLFGLKYSVKNMCFLAFLVVLPNILGAFKYTTVFGLRVHFFQYAIFLTAILYGPVGGALSGALGSLYVAYAMSNPYILFGNVLLGYFTGYFARTGTSHMRAMYYAYALQIPWLVLSDIFLANMTVDAVGLVVVSLTLSNIFLMYLSSKSSNLLKTWIR
ncbi:MAG: ECF transporter S component [Candidatus Altiarchaeota archaeon]|nr:ECF transporter S component [Candidatus Altiarchaeota archaeon]